MDNLSIEVAEYEVKTLREHLRTVCYAVCQERLALVKAIMVKAEVIASSPTTADTEGRVHLSLPLDGWHAYLSHVGRFGALIDGSGDI